MATIISREINGVNFQIFAEGWETRSSWGHRAKLFMNGYEISDAKIRYYNRTWEAYTYQSTIRAAIYIKSFKESRPERFRSGNGRTTAGGSQRHKGPPPWRPPESIRHSDAFMILFNRPNGQQ